MKLEISGQVTGIRIGCPGARLDKGPMKPIRTALGSVQPDQSDTEVTAWFSEQGLPEGSYDLGPIADPGTPGKKLILIYTPEKGPAGVGEIQER
jgi:hypothetical protein